MRYVRTENSTIVEGPMPLPNAWRNFSGFQRARAEVLASLGWLPYYIEDAKTFPHQIEDGHKIEIFPDKVVKTRLWRERTPEEMAQYLSEINAGQKLLRQAAYTSEADPLFFKWQRGEITQDSWTAKIAEIRARYPYAEAP